MGKCKRELSGRAGNCSMLWMSGTVPQNYHLIKSYKNSCLLAAQKYASNWLC